MESKARLSPARPRQRRFPVFATRRLRDGVEFGLAFMVWGLLVALAAGGYRAYVERAYVAEVLTHAITIKQEMTAARAASGRWPASVDVPIAAVEGRKRPPAAVEHAEGAFTFVLGGRAPGYRVSFRAAVSEFNLRAPVFWLCGYAAPPPGYRVAAPNRTDIPMAYLPAACRGDT